MASGLTYKETIVMYRAAIFLMEEIVVRPSADDDELASAVYQFVEEELKT